MHLSIGALVHLSAWVFEHCLLYGHKNSPTRAKSSDERRCGLTPWNASAFCILHFLQLHIWHFTRRSRCTAGKTCTNSRPHSSHRGPSHSHSSGAIQPQPKQHTDEWGQQHIARPTSGLTLAHRRGMDDNKLKLRLDCTKLNCRSCIQYSTFRRQERKQKQSSKLTLLTSSHMPSPANPGMPHSRLPGQPNLQPTTATATTKKVNKVWCCHNILSHDNHLDHDTKFQMHSAFEMREQARDRNQHQCTVGTETHYYVECQPKQEYIL